MNNTKSNIVKHTLRLMAAAVATGAMTTGCVNMDLEPSNEPSESSVWNSPTMAAQVANGAYRGLQYKYQESWNLLYQPFSSVIDRDANWTDFNHTYGRTTSTDGYISSAWSAYYEYAIKANSAVNGLPKVPGMDETKRSRLISECVFIRAFFHYQLNVLFQGVPYVREDIKSPADAHLSRLTADQVWDEIIKDLNSCIENPDLPNKHPQGSAEWGHITKSCAYALRGKVYMWKKEWQKAADDFQKVKECGHQLYTTGVGIAFKNVLKEAQEDCDEMIFSVCFTPEVTYGNALNRAFGNRVQGGGEGWTNFIVNPSFVDLFENADGSEFDWDDYIPGYNSMSTQARRVFFLRDNITEAEYEAAEAAGADMSKYLPSGNEARIRAAYANRDPRLNMTVVTPYDQFLGGVRGVAEEFTMRFPFRDVAIGDYKTDIAAMFYYTMRKFVNEGVEGTKYYNYIDVPVIRYAEVLLDWAECLNELGDVQGAVGKVNELRRRAGAQELNSNAATRVNGQDDMRRRIRNEHYFELGGEESNYFNEIRWRTWREKKFYTDNQGQMNGMRQCWGTPTYRYYDGGESYYTWPIPEKEIQINPNMKQSPEWL